MPDDPNGDSPNTQLAKTIVEKLIDEGLIPENKKSELEAGLTGSGVSQDDWNLWADLSSSPPQEEEPSDV